MIKINEKYFDLARVCFMITMIVTFSTLVFHVYLVFKYGINLYDKEMRTTLFLFLGSAIYLNKKKFNNS